MKNFKEDESYFQKIEIIQASSKKKKEEKEVSKNIYDIQFLPESGHIIESIENTIGIIVKNKNSNGVNIKEGQVFDSKKNLIAKFNTNLLGIGSFDFIYKSNEEYTAEITFFDKTKIIKKIPRAEKKGTTLSIFNPNTTFISIFVKTNSLTLKDLIGKEYTLYIHNTNKTLKQTFIFNEGATEYNINLNSKKLAPGINIVTLLSENNTPLAERIFFNYNKNLFDKPTISLIKKNSDSLSINIYKNKKETYYLSASILPESTKSYNPKNNIISSFLIKPYINGKIESPSYYFNHINRNKLRDLDLLLLTQGWSKYKWHNIFNNPPVTNFEFERGISIDGTINSNKESKTVFLISPENNLILSAPIENNKFKFEHLNLKQNTKISLSTKQKKKIKAEKIYLQFSPLKTDDKMSSTKIEKTFNISTKEVSYNNFIGERTKLDEFTIKSRTKKVKKNNSLVIGPSRSYKIDENFPLKLRVLTFIKTKRFNVKESIDGVSIFSARGATISLLTVKPTKVYLDNNLIQDESGYSSLDQLLFTTLSDIKEIIISQTGFGEIHIFSNDNFKNGNKKKSFSKNEVSFGYAIEKEYYQPSYVSFHTDFYKKYGAIFWKPRIKIDDVENSSSFKIPNTNQKYMKIFLEGITSTGKIIYEEQLIEVK
ncbi:hypothetical protein [Polaribacter sp. ALD11]|uniref:hypothetical protein n=1 Tax=Polaribacter sp. ALD11 TaxID=2058137 RepID=UPI0012FD86E1|nr:hypothetical protein [Polaribacter sp. ALD11]